MMNLWFPKTRHCHSYGTHSYGTHSYGTHSYGTHSYAMLKRIILTLQT